jgi:hypothetical protein
MGIENIESSSLRPLDFDQQVAQIVGNEIARRRNAINRELASQLAQNLAQQIVNQPTPFWDKAMIFLFCLSIGVVTSLVIVLPIYLVASAVAGAALGVLSVL